MKVLLFRFCNGFIWIILMAITLQCLFFSGMLNVNNVDASPSGGEKPKLEFISWGVGQWDANANSFITDTETYCTLNACVSYADDQPENMSPLTSFSWEIEMTHGFDAFQTVNWYNGFVGDVNTDFWMYGWGHGDAHGAKGRGGPMSVTIKFKGTYYDADNDLKEVVEEIVIKQDKKDQVRQEYLDHGITVPSRDDFTKGDGEYNTGDYRGNDGLYIDNGVSGVNGYHSKWAAECQKILRKRPGKANAIITKDDLQVTSAYRNPEYNQRENGALRSRHQYGDALDVLYVDLDDKNGEDKAGDAPLMKEAAEAAGATKVITDYSSHVHADWRPE